MLSQLTPVFIIRNKTAEKLLTTNTTLRSFKNIHFIYTFRPEYPVFRKNTDYIESFISFEQLTSLLNLENIIILYPEEVLPSDFKIHDKNICIETITDRNVRQNNLLHYEERIFNISTADRSKSLPVIQNHLYFFPELFNEQISFHKLHFRENALSALFLARHDYEEITAELIAAFLEKADLTGIENLGLRTELAKKHLKAANNKEAAKLLRQINDEYGGFTTADFLLADLYFQKFDYEKAKEYYKKCTDSSKNHFPYPVKQAYSGYLANYNLGLTYLNLNKFDKAFEFFEKALKAENSFLPAKLAVETVKPKLAASGKAKFTLSVCMIVKNEETFIEKAINSVKDIADEIIILDTGSTDKTPDLIKKAGSESSKKNIRLYHTEWKKDFSEARNESLSYASSDWILYIDGDEAINPEHLKKISQLLNEPSKLAYLLPVKSYFETGSEIYSRTFYSYRLFRNLKGIRFSGALHEQLIESLKEMAVNTGLAFGEAEAEIEHFGYTTAGKQKDRINNSGELEAELISRELENSELTVPRKIYFLTKAGILLLIDNKAEQAFEKLSKARKLAEELTIIEKSGLPSLSTLYYALYEYFMIKSKPDEAGKTLQEGLAIFPGNITLLDKLADIYSKQKKFSKALLLLTKIENLIVTGNYYKLSAFNDSLLTWETAFKLGKTYFALHEFEKAEEYFTKVLVNAPPAQIVKALHAMRQSIS